MSIDRDAETPKFPNRPVGASADPRSDDAFVGFSSSGSAGDRLGSLRPPRTDLLSDRLLEFLPIVDAHRILDGVYAIEERIGRGGFGTVYRARHVKMARTVAIKFLLTDEVPAARADEMRARFLREARILAEIDSPGVVRIFDVRDDGPRPHIVMEFVSGSSLATLVRGRAGHPIDDDSALRIVRDAARAIGAAHQRGIVHRDVKPENILLDQNGRVVVIDFGIARPERTVDGGSIHSSGFFGTPNYAAPEQIDATDPVDARADVYSLGATLFALLVGHAPYAGMSPVAIMKEVTTAPFPDIRRERPDLSAHVAALLDRSVARSPLDRPKDASALADELDACLNGKATATISSTQPANAPVHRRKLLIILPVVAILAAAYLTRRLGNDDGSPMANGRSPIPVPAWADVVGDERDGVTGLPKIVRDRATGIEMVLIPAGSFVMGSPRTEENSLPSEWPEHRVTITKPLYFGRYEVRQDEWFRVMGVQTSRTTGDDLPVTGVSWNDITAKDGFLDVANRNSKTADSHPQRMRLSTEAEWEYACRAGTRGPFSFDLPVSSSKFNFNGQYKFEDEELSEDRNTIIKVGSFAANPWGLFDMHGNVAEWCRDSFTVDFYTTAEARRPDPVADDHDAQQRVHRGGAYYFAPAFARSAARSSAAPNHRGAFIGFRVVRTAP